MRYVGTFLISMLVASSGFAQSLQEHRDLETGEPVPAGFSAPPADYGASTREGGFELVPIQHVAEGSTKLVRTHPNGVLFQNGAYLISGEILHPQPDTAFVEEFDRVSLPAQPADMIIRDNLAYVALRKNKGLLILDVTNPLEVEEVGALDGEDLLAIDVFGNYAFVGRGLDGIGVYDISDPANPVLVHSSDTPGSANGIAVDGTTMYVADGNNTIGADFQTYDISHPANPVLLGEFEAGGFVTYVAIAPTGVPRVLLAGDFGLKVLNVSDPANPVEVGSLSLGGETTYEIATLLSNSPIFVAGLAGVFSVDIGDPTMPEVVQSYEDVGQGLSVAVHEFHLLALLSDRYEGLRITDASLTGGSELPQIGLYETAGFSNKVFFYGDELYVTEARGRLRILDVSDVYAGVEEIARIDIPYYLREVHVEDGRAYVTHYNLDLTGGLTILDVSDPTNPQIIGEWSNLDQAHGLDVTGNTLYLANDALGLVALDVSDPADIQELGSFPMGITVDVVVDSAQAVAYAVNYGDGMYSIDVSNPANMQQLDAETDWGFLHALAFAPDLWFPPFGLVYALVADEALGFRFVELFDPSDLQTRATAFTPFSGRDVAGGYFVTDILKSAVYLGDDSFGFRAYSVLGLEIGWFESGDRGVGVASVADELNGMDLVVMASGETGLYFFEGPFCCTANEPESTNSDHLLGLAMPNPVRSSASLGFTIDTPLEVRLDVYDLLGRRVATLVEGIQTAGTHEVTFDASSLPSGVYILRLAAGDQIATTKVSVVH